MRYEIFEDYFKIEEDVVNKDEIKELWKLYQELTLTHSEDERLILKLMTLFYEDMEVLNCGKIKELITILISVLKILYNSNYDLEYSKEEIEKIFTSHDLSSEDREICFMYIYEIIEEIQKTEEKINYYVNNIQKILTPDELNEIIKLDVLFEDKYDDDQSYEESRKIIVEGFNKKNYTSAQSNSWCMGKRVSYSIVDIEGIDGIAKLLLDIYQNEDFKYFLTEDFILGILSNLNDERIYESNTKDIKTYQYVDDDKLTDIVNELLYYLETVGEDTINKDSILKILEKTFKDKSENKKIDSILFNADFSLYSEFCNLLKEHKLNSTDIASLWEDYLDIEESRCDKILVDMLLLVYPYKKICDLDEYERVIMLLDDIYSSFLFNLPSSYDEKKVDETLYYLNSIIDNYDINKKIKDILLKYVDEVVLEKQVEYYDEINIKEFYKNNLMDKRLTSNIINSTYNECIALYDHLTKISLLDKIPNYIIKNVILNSYLDYSIEEINFCERINLCIGLCYMKKGKTLEEINNIIFDFYNNSNIDKKYKDNFFVYGVLTYLKEMVPEKINKTKEMQNGVYYYSRDELNDNELGLSKEIENIAINVNDYWNDLCVKNHDRNFQFGIICKGTEYIDGYILYTDEESKDDILLKLMYENNN